MTVLLALTVGGCRTPPPQPTAPQVQNVLGGDVVHVNRRQGYVVVRCTVLPRVGKEVTVFRRDEAVGKVRITEPISAPYATADILEGTLMKGDRIRE